MRLIVVVGARPNFIKVAPLMPALAAGGIDAGLVHTGQHYDALMSDVFFEDLTIPEPRWFLDVGSGTHAVQTAAAMVALETLFETERPDAVVVVGDVNSTLAGALAAAKLGLPVVHLEAGLRSRDMSMPEEVNRLVADQLSAMLLAPSRDAMENLAAEGCEAARVHFVGNIMAESCLRNVERAKARDAAARFGMSAGGYILATTHRPENTDHVSALAGIVAALEGAELPVLLPVHPRTRPAIMRLGIELKNTKLIDPVGYLDMLSLEAAATAIVTDSGGVQEEACLLGVPCVTVRRNTERTSTIELGANRLAAADEAAISRALIEALGSHSTWTVPERWDVRVSERVTAALLEGVVPLIGCGTELTD